MEDYELYVDTTSGERIKMANTMLRSRKYSTVLHDKLDVLCQQKLQTDRRVVDKTDGYGNCYSVDTVEIKAGEIQMLVGKKGGSFYTELKDAAIAMKQAVDVFEDPSTRQFTIRSLYESVTYSDGVLHIEMSPDARGLLYDVDTNFTLMSVTYFALSLKASLKLYKLLRTYCYKNLTGVYMNLPQEEQQSFKKAYSVDEMRAILGCIDFQQSDEMRRAVSKAYPDWRKINEIDQSPMYRRFSDFKLRILEPAVREINDKTDIYLSIGYIKSGRGGKTSEIEFTVQYNKKFYEQGFVDSDNVRVLGSNGSEIIEEVAPVDTELVAKVVVLMKKKYDIGPVQAELLLRDAKGDYKKVEKAYHLSLKQAHITSVIGWLRAAIRNEFTEGPSIEVRNGSTEAAREWNNASENVWKKATETPEFAKFTEYIEEEFGDMENFNLLYETPEKKFKQYVDWKIAVLQAV